MQLSAQISWKREDAEMREFRFQLRDHEAHCDKCGNNKTCSRRPKLGESRKVDRKPSFKKVDTSDT